MIDISNKKDLYKIYRKRKPSGRYRVIHAPCVELKKEQKNLAKYLEILYNPPDCVFGFIEGRSAADMAKLHVGKDWLITLDIKDFFPSITKEHLLSLGLNEYWCEIATYNGKVIQGSPASPIISNMILRFTDRILQVYGNIMEFTYSRYADDIAISGMGKPKWEYIKYIKSHLNHHGLKLNRNKIKFMFKNEEQKVLGITVNEKVSINHKIRKKFKNHIKYNAISDAEMGYLSYINSVNQDQAKGIKNDRRKEV